MFTKKKSLEFLKYVSLLSDKELKDDEDKLKPHVKELSRECKEVYYYIIGSTMKLSPKAEEIYRNLLK